MKVVCESLFTVTSPFEIKIEAEDEEAAQKRAEELIKEFWEEGYTEELLEVSPSSLDRKSVV